MLVRRKPSSVWSKLAVASLSIRDAGVPACASSCASAIETQPAWAAAINSSGLVFSSACSARELHFTVASCTTPLSVETCPEPPIRSPSHVAFAVRSTAIVVPLFLAGTGRAIVPPPLQLVGQVVDLESARVGVGVDVALAAPELLRAVVMRVAQRVRRAEMPVLADILLRFPQPQAILARLVQIKGVALCDRLGTTERPRYLLITDEMEQACPALSGVPQERRVSMGAGAASQSSP